MDLSFNSGGILPFTKFHYLDIMFVRFSGAGVYSMYNLFNLFLKATYLFVVILLHGTVNANDIFKNDFEQNIAVRVSSLEVVDPHLSVLFLDFFCSDVTAQLNTLINESITIDNDMDGFLDSSIITQFSTDQPDYLTTRSLNARFVDGNCPDPLHSSPCEIITPTQYMTNTTFSESADCLFPIVDTTGGYDPSPNTTGAACYATNPQTTTINVAGVELNLMGFQHAQRYQDMLTMDQGLMMGFISEVDAEMLTFPMNIPVVGGQSLASLLPGGLGNCSETDDRDIFTDGQTSGWWFYFNTTSELIELQE